jgi:hypothetical protein
VRIRPSDLKSRIKESHFARYSHDLDESKSGFLVEESYRKVVSPQRWGLKLIAGSQATGKPEESQCAPQGCSLGVLVFGEFEEQSSVELAGDYWLLT